MFFRDQVVSGARNTASIDRFDLVFLRTYFEYLMNEHRRYFLPILKRLNSKLLSK